MQDMKAKGRRKGRGGLTGNQNGRSVLDAGIVVWLRGAVYYHGIDTEVAQELGLSVSAVQLARTGRTWRHLPMPSDLSWDVVWRATLAEVA